MTQWIHRNNLFLVSPLLKWSNTDGWFCIGEIGPEWENQSTRLNPLRHTDTAKPWPALDNEEHGIGVVPMVYLDFVAGNGKGIVNGIRTSMS
jgi:hypothetical protein